MTLRFVVYSHDGLGLGHVRRSLALATAITRAEKDATVLVAASVDEGDRLGLAPRVDILKLPSIRKLDNQHYAGRRLVMPAGDILALRSAVLEATIASFRPDVLLVDKHPVGVGGELTGALERTRTGGGQVVFGMRDILDDPSTVRREWRADQVPQQLTRYYDQILVYGNRTILDPVNAYGVPSPLAERVRFCGYVLHPGATVGPGPSGGNGHRARVVATAGGGEDGFRLLDAFLATAVAEGWDGTVVAGPQSGPKERRRLEERSVDAGVEFRTFCDDVPALMAHADAAVCMGGYNTLVEALATGTPVVCVPRTRPRAEQLIRARAFGRLGLLRPLEPQDLTPEALGDAVEDVRRRSRPALAGHARTTLGLDGAERAAAHLLQWALTPPRVAATAS